METGIIMQGSLFQISNRYLQYITPWEDGVRVGVKLSQSKVCNFPGPFFQTWFLEFIPVSVKSIPVFRLSDQNASTTILLGAAHTFTTYIHVAYIGVPLLPPGI